MNNDDYKKLYDSDPQNFIKKFNEELFELGQAVNHFVDRKSTAYDVAEELADVTIQIEKVVHMIGHFKMEFVNETYDLYFEMITKKKAELKKIIDAL